MSIFMRLLIFYPLVFFSLFVRKENGLWIVIGRDGGKFLDNAKYFYLYIQTKTSEFPIKVIFVTSDKDLYNCLKKNGYLTAYLYSLKGFILLTRAEVLIVDNLDWSLRGFGIVYALTFWARKVQLWHGIPIKKIEFDNKNDIVLQYFAQNDPTFSVYLRRLIHFPRFVRYDKVLCPSKAYKKIFSSAFRVSEDKLIVGNYPRNDFLLRPELFKGWEIGIDKKCYQMLLSKKAKGYKLIFYLPTFRDTNWRVLSFEELRTIDAICSKLHALFIIKPHPWDRMLKRVTLEYVTSNQSKNIIYLKSEEDIYPYLLTSDVLITDISSVQFDYLLLDKPIVYFFPDYKMYKERDRELYFELNEIIPSRICTTIECLIDELLKSLDQNFSNKRKQLKLKKLVFGDIEKTLGCEVIIQSLVSYNKRDSE